MPGARARAPRTELARTVVLSLVVEADHYEILVQKVIREARVSLWIATANVKELRVEAPLGTVARAKGRYVSILETFGELLARGVEIRFLHAGLPSRAFREELGKRPSLERRVPMRQCPRVHLKMVAVEGQCRMAQSFAARWIKSKSRSHSPDTSLARVRKPFSKR